MSLASKRVYQFGDFRLRVSARVLEREGQQVPLGSKAFEVLTCLVTNAGEVVTKDKLLKTVWPESFVEEGNLSQHIFALRKALGDQARYIVTVPGRGYQFTEVVHDLPESTVPAANDAGTFLLQRTRERTHIVIEETSHPGGGDQLPVVAQHSSDSENGFDVRAETHHTVGTTILRAGPASMEVAAAKEIVPGAPAMPQRGQEQLALPGAPVRRRLPVWMTLTVTVAVAVAALLGTWFAVRRWTGHAVVSQRVVLAELENRTGDAGFDVVLRNALEIDLDQSPYMDVMSESEKLNTLRLMGRSAETALVPGVAREVCERSNREVLITGSVASVGRSYLLTLEATDCNSGKILAGAKGEAASKEKTLAALDAASAKLRHGLGESTESLERYQVPIAQATTPSIEALKQYSLGEYLLGRMGKEEGEVLPFFVRAVELDPQFAMAHAALATGYYSLGETELATPEYQKAFDLSGQVSEKERLYIRAHFYSDAMNDVRQGLAVYQMWAETYPRDWGAWLNIENEYAQIGQFDAAILAGQRALALDSTRGIVYSMLARNYMHADRLAEAQATAKRAEDIGRDSTLLRATVYETAMLEHDQTAMNREVQSAAGKQGSWDLLNIQAMAAMRQGRHAHAAELFRAAYNAAAAEGLPEKADGVLLDQASADLNCGMPADARALLSRLRPQHAATAEAALVLAQLGDVASARRFLAAEASGSETDTLMYFVQAPKISAAIALNEGKPAKAIDELQPAANYDYASGYSVVAERGEAYLAAKQPVLAAEEFRKILNHPGVDPVSVLYPTAWLGLARAEALSGRSQESRADYESFFAQWKQADENLPLLLAARREYATLDAAK